MINDISTPIDIFASNITTPNSDIFVPNGAEISLLKWKYQPSKIFDSFKILK
jgi:hypothetical protein